MHEEMRVVIEAITTNPTPVEILFKIMYLAIDKQDDLIAQIAILPPHAEIDTVATADF